MHGIRIDELHGTFSIQHYWRCPASLAFFSQTQLTSPFAQKSILGRSNTVSGKKVIRNRTTIRASSNGIDSLVNSSIEHLVIEQTVNRTEPIGGDTEPMVRLTMRTTPK